MLPPVDAHAPTKSSTDATSRVSRISRYRGLTIAAGLFVVLLLGMRIHGIPLKFSVSNFLERYSVVGIQSIAYSLILGAIGMPTEIFAPMKERYRESPLRLVILGLLGALFFYLYPPFAAAVFLLVSIGILEAYDRGIAALTLTRPLLPAIYLFVGLITVFGFNAYLVTIRTANYSSIVATLDSYLLFGHSASELSHRFCASAPDTITTALMISYFALFAQIGACLLITSLKVGREEGIKFVSTILFAYLITMLIFAAFPTFSPYFTCADHQQAKLPQVVLEAQQGLMQQLRLRQHHANIPIDTEYYVAFPCMHIAQPLIVLWFLRRWRRILAVLIVVDTILAAAIVLLEWHYVTDLLGGVAVAGIAIVVNTNFSRETEPSSIH